MKKAIAILLLSIVLITGCDSFAKESVDAVLYFPLKDAQGCGKEVRTIKYSKEKDRIEKTMDALLEGPKDRESFTDIAGDKIHLLGIEQEGSSVSVDLKDGFQELEIEGRHLAIYCIASTLLEYPDIERVEILVEGESLKDSEGLLYGYFDKDNIYKLDLKNRIAILYFSDSQAMYVVPEEREIILENEISDEEYIRIVLQELIKGPETADLYATIPEEVRVLDLELEGDLLYIDFSEEMHTKHWGGAAGESMTLHSLANTLGEIEGIERILVSVEGRELSIEHMIIDEPIKIEDFIGENQ